MRGVIYGRRVDVSPTWLVDVSSAVGGAVARWVLWSAVDAAVVVVVSEAGVAHDLRCLAVLRQVRHSRLLVPSGRR